MAKRLFLLWILFGLSMHSCTNSSGDYPVIGASKLPKTEVRIKRYGKALFELDKTRFQEELKAIQAVFPQFLNDDLNDSANISKLYNFVSDTQLIALYHETIKVYPELTKQEKSLAGAFAYLKYYFPSFTAPQVYTYISGIQFDAPVMTADNSLVIGLDCYLGENQPRYKSAGIPAYQMRCMTPSHIEADVVKAIYAVYFERQFTVQTILDEMVHTGIRYAFIKAMLPDMPDHILLGYSEEQYRWIRKNEASVWRSIVGEELLYKGDQKLFRKFFGDGPFTQEFSTEAPPRIGDYIGWQIVRQYAKQKGLASPQDLLALNDAQGVLAQSRYKPK